MSIKRINQLGYFKADGERARHPAEPGRREQGRRDLQGRGAEPQPVHLRRRRLGLRGHLHQRLVLDHQLPGRRRDVPDLRPERQPHQELLALGERAVLPRPADHRRRRRLQAQDHLLQLRQRRGLHAGEHRRQPGDGLHGGEVVARLPQLHVRGDQALRGRPGRRHEPLLPRRGRRRRHPGPDLRPAAVRRLRQADGEPHHAEPGLQHGRQPVHAARRHAPHGDLHVRGRAARRHRRTTTARRSRRSSTTRSAARWRSASAPSGPSSTSSATPRCCRSTSATSWAARRRSAATTSAPSARSTRRAEHSAATSSACSTPSTTSTCSARCGRSCSSTPARPSSRATRSGSRTSGSRPAPSCASSCPC